MKKFFIFFDSRLSGVMGILIKRFDGCKVESIGVFNHVEIFSVTGKDANITEAKKRSTELKLPYFLTESVNA